jgi:mannosylfructose-phosphate synthase
MEANNHKFRNVCMLSTHGYFDPVPELGKIDTGGQVLYVLNIAYSLAKMDVNVDIYTRWFDPSKKQIETLPDSSKIRIIRIPAGGWEFIPKEQIYGVLPELAKNMIDFINENGLNYDLFHGHYVDAGIVALKVSEAFSKPVFFTAHSLGAWKKQLIGGDPEKMDKKYNFKHRISEELRIFQSVNGQTVTSREEESKIKELYNFKPERIEFIPPGVDVHKFRPLQQGEKEKEIDIKLPDEYILMLSRTSNAKGHDLLLKAYVKVLEDFDDVNLVFCLDLECQDIEGLNVLSKIKSFVEENQIEEKINLLGTIHNDHLPVLYRKAEIYVLPARFEPFGMAALEAMACQVPVVISKFAGIQENLTAGEDYLKVDPHNTQQLADTITHLLKNEKLADRLAEKGRETVLKNFSWEAIAKRIVEFYNNSVVRTKYPTNIPKINSHGFVGSHSRGR